MFQIDNETGLMKEYTDFFSLEAEKQYWMKMIDLVYDIHDTLTFLERPVESGSQEPVQTAHHLSRRDRT